MKKKILLGLGAPVAIVSTFGIIACSTNTSDTNTSASLTTDEAKQAVLQTWVNGILNENLNTKYSVSGVDVQNAFDGSWDSLNTTFTFTNNSPAYYDFRNKAIQAWNFFQSHKVQQNKNGWKEFDTTVLKANGINISNFNPEYNKSLPIAGLSNPESASYNINDENFEGTNIFVQMYNINKTTVANSINQLLLSQEYFTNQNEANIKKGTDYSTVTETTGTSNEKSILEALDVNNPNFLLLKYLLENQVFQKWEFNDKTNFSNFSNQTISTIDGTNGFNSLFSTNNTALNSKERIENVVKINDNVNWNISENNLPTVSNLANNGTSLANYSGVKTQNEAGSEIDYSLDTLKKAKIIESGFLNSEKANQIYSINELMRNSVIKYYFEKESTVQNQSLSITLKDVNVGNVSDLTIDNFAVSTPENSIFDISLNGVSQIGTTNAISASFDIKLNLDSSANGLTDEAKTFLKNASFIRNLSFTTTIYTSSTNSVINGISFNNSSFSNNINLKYGGNSSDSEQNIFSSLSNDLVSSVPIKVGKDSATLSYINKIVPLFSENSSKFSFINTPWADTIENNYAVVNSNLYYSIFSENKDSIFTQIKAYYVKLGNTIEITNNTVLETAARSEGILKV